jgi:hypothetical protein
MVDCHSRPRRLTARLRTRLAVAIACVSATLALHAQQEFQLFLAVMDETGAPVSDLRAADVAMMENGAAGRVSRLEPSPWPIKLTVLVDNGGARFGDGAPREGTVQHGLVNYRNGLRALTDALPQDIEVEVIATSPTPLRLARPTTDRQQIRKGIDVLIPDEALGRANDAFVEYAERLDSGLRGVSGRRSPPYRPALVSIATTGRDGSTAQRDALLRMLNSLVQYRTLVSIVMVSLGRTTAGGGVNDVGVNEGAHILVAKAAQELTGGHYEQISDSNALPKLLADIGRRIAATHVRQTTQYLMTIERPAGASGPIKDLRLSIARKGVGYMVSADGVYR